MKKLFKIILILLGLLCACLLISTLIWPPINDVETGKTAEYSNIQPIDFKTDVITTFWTAARTAKTMPLWVLTSVQQKDLRIRAEARTPSMGFIDLVEITIVPINNGSQVRMRSRSQLGRSDFGVNARRIETYFKRLKTNMEIIAMHERQSEAGLHK
tara:strand:+ start:164 stop:634 length:471 start_codon:yes stop_codon:yes gene_type:complete